MIVAPTRLGLRGKRHWPAIALVLLGLAPFLPALLTGSVFTHRDQLTHFLPRQLLLSEKLSGEGSLAWTSRISIGAPFAADPQAGVHHPPALLLFGALPFPTAHALYSALHFVLLGLATFALLRELGRRRESAFLASLGVLGSGPLFAALDLVNNLASLAFLPLSWFLALRTARTGTWRLAALTAVTTCLSFTAGEPQLAAGGSLVTAALLLGATGGTSTSVPTRRRCLLLTVVATLAAGLSAAQALPFLEWVRLTLRSEGIPWRLIATQSLTPSELVGLALPDPFLNDGAKWSAMQSYLPSIYLGVLPLLAVSWLRRKDLRRLGIWWLVLLGSLALAFGANLPGYRFLHDHLHFSSFRYPPRFLFFFILALAVIGSRGLDRVAARLRVTTPTWRLHAGALGFVVLLTTYILTSDWPDFLTANLQRGARRSFLIVVAFVVLLECGRRLGRRWWLTALLATVVVLDLGTLPRSSFDSVRWSELEEVASRWSGMSPIEGGPPQRAWCRITDYVIEDTCQRQLTTRDELACRFASLDRGLAILAGGAEVRRDPIYPLVDYEPLHAALEAGDRRVASYLGTELITVFRDPEIVLQGLRSDPSPLRLGRPVASDVPAGRAVREGAPGTAVPVPLDRLGPEWKTVDPTCLEQGRVVLSTWTEDELVVDVDAACPLLLVHVTPLLPGWRGAVDGVEQELLPAFGILQAIPVPSGRHEVTFTYRSSTWRLGLMVSTLSLLVVGLLALTADRARGRATPA
ncbi:MAG: hypothetical protein AAF533_17570 [Acidobacteriota bacterium]